jgi:hypothetical protein
MTATLSKNQKLKIYDKIQRQLRELHREVSLLSKSKPDNPINTFKLNFINEKLGEANMILEDTDRPFAEFETFDETNLPSNSDVALVLSQYVSCLERWFHANRPKSATDLLLESSFGSMNVEE